MTRIQLYDTTLRDGMQGEGMSLSAQEKLRVAHRLDELGIDLIEAGFPSSNPKELELFELLARERFEHAEIAAFGMTRRRGRPRRRRPGAARSGRCFAPVCTLVGKTWALHLEKVVKVDREENLRMIAESVAFLAGDGQAGRSTTPSISSTASPTTAHYALAVPAGRGRGGRRDRRLLRHQRWHAARTGRGAPMRAVIAALGRASGSESTATTTPAAASRTRSPPSQRGRDARPGHDQRLRRALRQRQPGDDHPQPAAEARLRVPEPTSSSRR